MPPLGVPIFTPRQFKEYYSRRNILVIGDSTSRRLYTTLYKVMQAADLEDIVITDIDGDPWKRVKFCEEFRYYDKKRGREHLCLNHTYITEIQDVNRNETMVECFNFDYIFRTYYNELKGRGRTKRH